jgi:prevent-host-death family protein
MASQQSMPVIIPATKAHRNFGDLVRRAFSGREHFIVEKDGLPVVAIISMTEYQELMKERERREERLKRFQQLARRVGEEVEAKGLTEADVEAVIEETREQLHQERYGTTK